MEDDFDVNLVFDRLKGYGEKDYEENKKFEIILEYKGIERVVEEGLLYISMIPSNENNLFLVDSNSMIPSKENELFSVDSKIMEFDQILQDLDLWYIYNIQKTSSPFLRRKINTAQTNKKQIIQIYFKAFILGSDIGTIREGDCLIKKTRYLSGFCNGK